MYVLTKKNLKKHPLPEKYRKMKCTKCSSYGPLVFGEKILCNICYQKSLPKGKKFYNLPYHEKVAVRFSRKFEGRANGENRALFQEMKQFILKYIKKIKK